MNDDVDVIETPRTYTEQLAFHIASGQFDDETVARNYNISAEYLGKLRNDPAFQETLSRYTREFQQNGITASLKAAMAVEMMIPTMFSTAMNPLTTPSEKKGIFDSLKQMAGLDKQAQLAVEGNQMTFGISVVFGKIDPGVEMIDAVPSPVPRRVLQ